MTTKIVGSKMKSEAGYSQNGNDHASSDLPGENTTTGFARTADEVRDKLQREGFADRAGNGDPFEDLRRKSSDTQYPPAHGMKKR